MMRIGSFNNKRVEKPPLTVTSPTHSSLVQTTDSWVGPVTILKAGVYINTIENSSKWPGQNELKILIPKHMRKN